jgi:secreted trypsin-like serine protease
MQWRRADLVDLVGVRSHKCIASALLAVLVASLVLACAANAEGCRLNRRVVGGHAAELKNWPGFAALRLSHLDRPVSIQFCGGAAIEPNWVVTAAHCFDDLALVWRGFVSAADDFSRVRIEVLLGTDKLDEITEANVFQIDRWVQHEIYASARKAALARDDLTAASQIAQHFGHDIALVKLAKPWHGELMRLSLTATADPVLPMPPDHLAMVAGFGATDPSARDLRPFTRSSGEKYFASTPELLEVALPLVGAEICKKTWPGMALGRGQYCAGFDQPKGKDSCNGDSGGPLVVHDDKLCPLQVGVVSWGPSPCAPGSASYGVYTRVSAFAGWLRQRVPGLR